MTLSGSSPTPPPRTGTPEMSSSSNTMYGKPGTAATSCESSMAARKAMNMASAEPPEETILLL